MEPQDLADIQEAALDAALAAGMDPDVSEVSYTFDPKTGDVSVKSTSSAGKVFDVVIPVADIAAALDADVAEDAGDVASTTPGAKPADAGAMA